MNERPAAADEPSRTRVRVSDYPASSSSSRSLFVMIAEVLIYVPSIANFRLNWLNDRLSAAYTAALVLEAAPERHGVRTAWRARSSTASARARWR